MVQNFAYSSFCGFRFLIKETKLGNLLLELQPPTGIKSLVFYYYRWSNPITSVGMEKPTSINSCHPNSTID